MFREMRRRKQQRTDEECCELLKAEKRGVLALHGEDGYPYAIPMNFHFDEVERKLYFHCAREGHKIDAINADNKACFTVFNQGYRDEGDWAYHVTSVVAFGHITPVDDKQVAYDKARALGLKYYPTAEGVDDEMEKAFSRVLILCMDIDHMTGKIVHEK